MADNEELRDIYNMFTESWKYYRKYSEVLDTDEYWESVARESIDITKKYGECKFIINLVLAVVTELERQAKCGKEGNYVKKCRNNS